MSSNLHPDMSGNPCDAPYVCEECGREFSDDAKLCGSFFKEDAIICSPECSTEYDYAIAEKLQGRAAALEQEVVRLKADNAVLQNEIDTHVCYCGHCACQSCHDMKQEMNDQEWQ